MNKNKYQNGFAIIELIVIIIVIVAIVAVGLYTFKSHKKADSVNATSNSPKQITNSTNIYSNWKTYSWISGGLTFKYPSDWSANNPQATATYPDLTAKPTDPVVIFI